MGTWVAVVGTRDSYAHWWHCRVAWRSSSDIVVADWPFAMAGADRMGIWRPFRLLCPCSSRGTRAHRPRGVVTEASSGGRALACISLLSGRDATAPSFHNQAQIIVLDVETTGTEKATDQIIELCLRLGLEPDAEAKTWRILPSIQIHPEATQVHGIKAEDLAGCPPFAEAAADFIPLLTKASIIVGYNVAFDLDMLQAELTRAGLPVLDLTDKQIIDVLRLWHHVEPRTLIAAHQKFCGTELVGAHQAEADVAATARVLLAMLKIFKLTEKSWSEIADISNPFSKRTTWLGPSSHIQWDASGAVIFAFGKYKGTQVVRTERGFLKWILARDFPPHVKQICTEALERNRQFNDWIAANYQRPSTPSFVQEGLP